MCLKQYTEKQYYLDYPIMTSDDAVQFVIDNFHDLDREIFFTIQLDENGNPMNFSIQHIGSAESSVVSPKEVLKIALLVNASSIILMHNHPGGTLFFSKDDVLVTKALIKAAKSVGLNVVEHYIFTPTKEMIGFYSEETLLEKRGDAGSFSDYSVFEDVRVKQVNYDYFKGELLNDKAVKKHINIFSKMDTVNIMLILTDREDRIKARYFYKIFQEIPDTKTILLEDICKVAVTTNSKKALFAFKGSLGEYMLNQNDYMCEVISAFNILEIQILDIYSVKKEYIQSYRGDNPQSSECLFFY